ncbi:hypothetical protein Tco_0764805 [Tanacetum coccineum]
MTTLQFADTHNLVAFLSKLAKSEGFEEIVDFLNANPIRYELTINLTIYTLCIEQFWAVKAKTVNEEGSAMPTDSYHTPIITQPHHLNLKGNKNLGGQRERTVRVIYLENTKTAQAQKITSLKKRVKKLEKKGGLRNHKLKRLYKVGLSARVESTDEASLGDQEDASK